MMGILTPIALSAQTYQLDLKLKGEGIYADDLSRGLEVSDSASAFKAEREIILRLQENGYLAASSKLEIDSPMVKLEVTAGEKYKWNELKTGNLDPLALRSSGFKLELRTNKAISPTEVHEIRESVIRYYEDRGYPFVGVFFDSIEVSGSDVSASLMVELNQFMQVDSVLILGAEKVKANYLYNSLDLIPGKAYNESKFAQIETRIAEIPFVNIKKKPEALFQEDGVQIYLYLEDKKANDLQGIIGFLPNAQTGSVTFTGDVKLALLNSLGQGESIKLNWRKLQENTQDMRVDLAYPFLFNSPFGLSAKLFLYRRDTLFNSFERSIGASYRLNQSNSLSIEIGAINNNILSTAGLETATVLPNYADIRTSRYSLAYEGNKLDYKYNPRNGRNLRVELGAGNRRIERNPDINPEIYDNLKLRSSQYNLQFKGANYFGFGKRNTFKTGFQVGGILGERVFQNELFRIGGIQTLRGFDIESIRASLYGILTLEYRFILERNSHLSIFSDLAYVEERSLEATRFDRPLGLGAGFNFDTRSGIFSLSYAIGQQSGNPLQFTSSKVHFGFVSIF
jgi:translocation and assembly module TamA